MNWKIAALSALFCATLNARADDTGGDSSSDKARYEMGFHLGNLLPNQINGVTEITSMGGVRVGARIAPLTFTEAGIIMGNGGGVEWKNAHLDVRMDIPVENLVGIAYVGGDTVYYKGSNGNSHLIFGGHVGGGLQVQLSGDLWFRGDMKFGFSPGTSLYVGFGLVFRMGGT